MKKSYLILWVWAIVILASCQPKKVEVNFNAVEDYVVTQLDRSIGYTEKLLTATTQEALIDAFKNARLYYKRAEPFAAAVNPESAQKVNGPPLPIYNEDSGKILPPIGFQAIGEQVFSDAIDSATFAFQVDVTLGYLNNLKDFVQRFPPNPRRFFPAVQKAFLSVFSLGITGFDTPTSLYGIEESAASFASIKEVYSISISDTIQLLNATLDKQFKTHLDEATAYLKENSTEFETFNRYEFGREYLNQLTRDWVEIRKLTGLYDDPKIYAINLDAPTFFEENSFNVDYFRTSATANPSNDQVLLGNKFFYDVSLSASGNLACSSCHNPEKAFQDGLQRGTDKNGNSLLRNTPTLINTIYQKKFFWDGRSDNLEQQIMNVFENDAEFNNNAHAIQTSDILQNEEYKKAFQNAFPGKSFNRSNIIKALSIYTSTLNAMNSRFDQNMRGELEDFTKEEILGMNLFMGKALCSTCHFIPLTNGTVPPHFSETEKEILGTPKTPENLEIDTDEGFYWVFEAEIHKYMFKTPTLRNIALTAPYMHNGVYDSLEQVMDFYNQGGGGGMGFEMEHQTLPFDSLSLTEEESDAIIAFMKTLTDDLVVEEYQ